MFERSHEPSVAFATRVRQHLHRRELAVERHRAAIARKLKMGDREMLAVAHLAQRGELSPSALGALLLLSSAGATALVERLERNGHVRRSRNPADARSSLLRLSPDLIALAEHAFHPLVLELEQIACEVAERDRAAVERFLARAAQATEEQADRLVREIGSRARQPAALPLPELWG